MTAQVLTLTLPRSTIDFETFSEISVKDVGAWRYAEHHSTEILCLTYDLPDVGWKLWVPELPFPEDLLEHVLKGNPLEAHNSQFERAVWYHKFHLQMGLPMPSRWICSQSVCAYRGVPLKLKDVGRVLNLKVQKNDRGKNALDRLSKPRRPTKKNPNTRTQDWDLYEDLYTYNIDDVRTEKHLSETLGDLPPSEYRLWVFDQTINTRGVHVDLELVYAAQKIIDKVTTELEKELFELTGGVVQKGTQTARMQAWLDENGLFVPNMQAETIEDVLRDPSIRSDLKRVLELRQQLSLASIKKVQKFIDCVCADGRMRGLLQYHGAGTGRWAGRLVQPQNFTKGTVKADWYELLITAIKKGYWTEEDELIFGEPLAAISSALRGMFNATPGKKLYVADFSAIEARVVMWVAGQTNALKAFRESDAGEGPDIYCVFASTVVGRPITKKDPERASIGKIGVLGCFEADTKVLSERGWIPIVDVRLSDKLWDGEEWVNHEGLIYQGRQRTIHLRGIGVTPDHMLMTHEGWMPAWCFEEGSTLLKSALEWANDRFPDTTSKPSLEYPPLTEPSYYPVPVYDLLNVGPRHRFFIRGEDGSVFCASNCGYQMGWPKLQMQAAQGGTILEDDLAKKIVDTFRSEYDEVPELWRGVEDAMINAVKYRTRTKHRCIGFEFVEDKAGPWLTLILPSGRRLWYFRPEVAPATIQYQDKETGETKSFTKDQLTYEGKDNKKGGAWQRISTYGGMAVENLTQAIARDLMVASMIRAEENGFPVVLTVHDEVISERDDDGTGSVKEFEALIAGPNPPWAKGLPVTAEAWTGYRYRK